LLESERLEEKTTREYLHLLAQENARLSRLIDNVLTFSRLERNKQKFEFAAIAPADVTEGALAAMRERCEQPGCKLATEIGANLPQVRGDLDALVTALRNLLDNAWKYTGEEKHIGLRAFANNGHVEFAVTDNGCGIPARETGRIFERFYRVDQRVARTTEGCGLGLSIVREIVAAHSGTVDVSSIPGRGSTFTIKLPALS
jgi:signal transduction histidine kinase